MSRIIVSSLFLVISKVQLMQFHYNYSGMLSTYSIFITFHFMKFDITDNWSYPIHIYISISKYPSRSYQWHKPITLIHLAKHLSTFAHKYIYTYMFRCHSLDNEDQHGACSWSGSRLDSPRPKIIQYNQCTIHLMHFISICIWKMNANTLLSC